MLNINPLLLVGGVIGAVTALLIFAYVSVKDKKTAMGFERTMADGEILRRLFAYAKPYWAKFLLVLFLMLFSIAYDIISPLIVGAIEELVAADFALRRHFGQMLQDVFLFSGTIRSNIVLREDNISDEEIMQVCRYVNADHFINKLDHGLDEEVRERGNNFSAGQRQLLSFARTIIHKPSVMILDEATANIDTETELLIQDSLEKMRTVGTMLIVAHRLSTIQHADNIIVLSHGKILEQGSHQELLARHGRYYQLYTLQYHKEQLSS